VLSFQSDTALPHFHIPPSYTCCLNLDDDLVWTTDWRWELHERETSWSAKGGNGDRLHVLPFVHQFSRFSPPVFKPGVELSLF
jgi:hypothetical protein